MIRIVWQIFVSHFKHWRLSYEMMQYFEINGRSLLGFNIIQLLIVHAWFIPSFKKAKSIPFINTNI